MHSRGIININKYNIFKTIPSFKKNIVQKLFPQKYNETLVTPTIEFDYNKPTIYKSDVENHVAFELTTIDKIIFILF
jgi:hypothetical protein